MPSSGITPLGRRLKHFVCEQCAEPFSRRTSQALRFCSLSCANRWRNGNSPLNHRLCAICSATVSPVNSQATLCSNRCKQLAYQRRLDPQYGFKRDTAAELRKATAWWEAEAKCLAKAIRLRRPKHHCLWCAAEIAKGHTCSVECRIQRKADTKAASRKARKALQRGVTVETVKPRVVFERDQWHCYLCGVSTPEYLRGTLEHNAPELEHVVPLARGGQHSYANVRCACKACNMAKGTKDASAVAVGTGRVVEHF